MQTALGSRLLIKEPSLVSISGLERFISACAWKLSGPSDRLICKVCLHSSVTSIIEPAPLREATAEANKHIIT